MRNRLLRGEGGGIRKEEKTVGEEQGQSWRIHSSLSRCGITNPVVAVFYPRRRRRRRDKARFVLL